MVKNTHGGNKHKQFARKHATEMSSTTTVSTRVSTDPNEVYAVVIRMLGNGMFHCFCMDKVTRLGHMRGKFSGRGKRDNMVKVGTWVLIGLREWEQPSGGTGTGTVTASTTSTKKMQHCDLLNVYSDPDKIRLRGTVRANWASFDAYCDTISGQTDKLNDDYLRFAECDDEAELASARVPPQRIPVAPSAKPSGDDHDDNVEDTDPSLYAAYTLDDI
jgi:translation initiation factor IF-1